MPCPDIECTSTRNARPYSALGIRQSPHRPSSGGGTPRRSETDMSPLKKSSRPRSRPASASGSGSASASASRRLVPRRPVALGRRTVGRPSSCKTFGSRGAAGYSKARNEAGYSKARNVWRGRSERHWDHRLLAESAARSSTMNAIEVVVPEPPSRSRSAGSYSRDYYVSNWRLYNTD
jgi:hypothetical protein